MTTPTVEELRELSHKIDDLYVTGKEVQGKALLLKALERSKPVPAYHLHFKAKYRAYISEDFPERKELLEQALSHEPDDYFLLRNMGVSLYLLERGEEALFWFDKALALQPNDYRSMRGKGYSLSKMGQDEEALTWFDKALALKSDDYRSMRGKGISLSKMGQDEEALTWLDKALASQPDNPDFMKTKGFILGKMGRNEEAFTWFGKALEVEPDDYYSMRQRGITLSKMGRKEEALIWLNKALAIQENDEPSLRNKAALLDTLNQTQQALAIWEQLLAFYPGNVRALKGKGDTLFSLDRYHEAIDCYHQLLQIFPAYKPIRERLEAAIRLAKPPLDQDELLRIRFGIRVEDLPRHDLPDDHLQEDGTEVKETAIQSHVPSQAEQLRLFDAMQKAWKAAGKLKDKFLQQSEVAQKSLDSFLHTESYFDSELIFLLGLRKWNSYTPTLPGSGTLDLDKNEDRSIGGGYFLFYKGEGIVIDPGFNFLENFHAMGGLLSDINHVFVTHAHNDHTNDLESIFTLFYRRRQNIKKKRDDEAKQAKEQKRKVRPEAFPPFPPNADYYLNLGSFQKFGSLINLRNSPHLGQVRTLTAGDEFPVGTKGLKVRVLKAYHDEMLSEDYAVGLLFTLPMEQRGQTKKIEKTLLFTSDTGYVPKKDTDLPQTETRLREIWHEYSVVKSDFLIPHMGSIKDQEFRVIETEDDFTEAVRERNVFYPNHLGFMGTAMLIRMLEPRHVFVSEFGEELKAFLKPLLDKLKSCVGKLGCKTESFLPMDRVFLCDLRSERIYSLAAGDFIPLKGALFDKLKNPDLFHYFSKGTPSEMRSDKRILHNLKTLYLDIEDKKGSFFKAVDHRLQPKE